LALILAAAAFIYGYRIGDKPLDFDERYSVNIAVATGGSPEQFSRFGIFVAEPLPAPVFHSHDYAARASLRDVVQAAISDNGQGLPYFLLLHFWLKAFGISAIGARSLSAVIMLGTLLLLYLLFRRLRLPELISLSAVALFAGNGVIIGLAQYTRFYSLGLLLIVVSLHLLLWLRNTQSKKSASFLLGLVWTLLFLTQYFSAFVILPMVWLVLRAMQQGPSFRKMALVIPGALLPILIWLWPLHGWMSLRNIYALHEHNWQAMLSLTTKSTPLNLAIGLASSVAGAFGQPVNFLKGALPALLHVAPAVPAFIMATVALKKLRHAPWIQLCAGALGVYTLASLAHAIATGHTLLFQVRYWVFAYVFSYGLMAYAWAFFFAGAKSWRWLCITVLAVSTARVAYTSASELSGLRLSADYSIQPIDFPPLEDYEAVALRIKHAAQPGDTLSFRDWKTAQMVNWYLLDRPELVQRVHGSQASLVELCQGGQRCDTVAIPRGRGVRARPVWLH
jgi:hypothetical protein